MLLAIPFGLFAQGYSFLTEDITDIRNNVWYYGSNSLNADEFMMGFINKFVKERVDITRNVNNLSEQDKTICRSLLNRGRNIGIPQAMLMFMIICDDTHGVLLLWMDLPNFPSDNKLATRLFFKLK